MSTCARKLAATIVLAAGMTSLASVAPAMPIADALAIRNAVPAQVETVQWRRGWGWGVGGFVAGAIIGGAIANSYAPYGYYPYGAYQYGPYADPYYAPPPGAGYYGPPGPAYGAGPGYGAGPAYSAAAPGDAVAYCMRRYKSYDPASGTFLGYDGLRHPCP